MNRNIVFNITGKLLEALSALLLLPMIISLIYREEAFMAFLITAVIAFSAGFTLVLITSGCKKDLYAREGFLIVALAWLSASVIGCLPFVISGEIPGFIDAFLKPSAALQRPVHLLWQTSNPSATAYFSGVPLPIGLAVWVYSYLS
ncbi:MAG: hypothetical protein IJN81_09745 [Clostridia bacterium]|nr:hypothetical protein [Clostridia bacterium]